MHTEKPKCNLWESVKELQLFCKRMDRLKHIFAFRKLSFCWKVSRLDNRLMEACYSLYSRSTEFLELICTFNIDVGVCSLVCVQSNVFSARQHIAYMLSALYAIACPSVRPSVRLSVCHTGGSYKNG